MGEVKQFRLPDVGEGLTEAEVLTWHVRVGDTVKVNEPLVEIETAKASVELPSPFAGVVSGLLVEVGQLVPVGTPLVSITVEATSDENSDQGAVTRDAVLVGYGVRVRDDQPRRRPRRDIAGSLGPHGTTVPEAGPPGEPVKPVRHGGLEVARHIENVLSQSNSESPVRAKPPVRRLARDLHVNLRDVPPTGHDGEVTREDVTRYSSSAGDSEESPLLAGTRIPVRGVARAMADAMVRSAFRAPHVTEWMDVDVSGSLAFLDRLRERAPDGVRLSPTTLAAHALVRACTRHPMVNASWDEEASEIVVHPRVNLGVAAATERGLVVPVVHGADALSLMELASALTDLVATAREGRTSPAAMVGGTVSLTNVGVFGVDSGTPILVPGQGAILCLGRILPRAWVVDGEVVARPVATVALSFDHRFVDGALGSTVLSEVAAYLADPAAALAVDAAFAR